MSAAPNGNASGRAGVFEATCKSDKSRYRTTSSYALQAKRLATIRAALSSRIWVLTYTLEEARQRYADRRQLLRQAVVCLMLALLRLLGVRFA